MNIIGYKRILLILIIVGTIFSILLKNGLAQEKRPYVIGSIFSYTGPAAFLGDRMKTTIEMKIEQINKQGGINGRPIKSIIYDAASEVTKAVMAAKRLIEQDKVDVIVGCGNMSGLALAIVPIVEKAGIPFMSVSGAAQIVTPVDQRFWTFKAHATDEEIIGKAIDYWKKIGTTKVAMLSDTTSFGKSARDELKKQAPISGINVVAWEEFDMNSTDLTPQLTRIRATDPQLILCWTVSPAGVVFLKNAKQLGMKQVLMHGFGFVVERYMEMAGDASEGCVLSSYRYPVGPQLPDADPCKKEILQYMKDHKERYGFYPDVYGAEAYDGLMIVVDALKRANSYDKREIRKAIENTRGLVTTLGINNFSPQKHYGLTKRDIVIFEWRNKGWKLLMPAEY